MKYWIHIPLLVALASHPAYGQDFAAGSVRPDRDYAAAFGRAEVPVRVSSGGRSSDSWLLGIQGGELELRPADAANPGERVFIPLDDIQEFSLHYAYPEELQEAREALRDRGPEPETLDILRPYVWPLVRYLPLPEDRFNIEVLVDAYLEGLIAAGRLDEAYAMVLEIPLARVPPKYIQHTLDLAERLVEAGSNPRALALLGIVPLGAEDDALLALLMDYAGQFRAQDNLDEALILYDRVRSVTGHDHMRRAVLWTAYCNVRLGRVESARLFLAEARPLAPRDAEFSLHQLVLARIGLRDGDFHEAMEQVSQGVVFSRIGYSWIPELLYTTGRCYEALGSPDTARTVYDQVILFFPTNRWADSSRTRLEALMENDLLSPEPGGDAAAPAPGTT